MYVLLYVLVSLTILSVDWLRICQNTCWRNVIVAKWNSLMGVLSFSFFYSLQEGFSKIVKLLCELSVLCLILKLDETVFPNGSGLIQHDNVPCHTTTIVQKWFEEHNSSMCWLGLQTHISIQMSMCRMYWRNKSDQWRAHLATYRTEDLLLTSWCQIPQRTFRRLVESMPLQVKAVLHVKGGPTLY